MLSGGKIDQFDNLAGVSSQSPVDDAGGLAEQNLRGLGCGLSVTGGHDSLSL